MLVRRYLDKDVVEGSMNASATIDSASKISFHTSTVTVTPFTAVATIARWLEGSKLDDLSCIDNDALSTSSTSVDDETLDSEAMGGALKCHQDQTHPNMSPAQEACSKIIEQNNERHSLRNLVEDMASQARLFILGSNSSDPSLTNKSTAATITATTATTTTTTTGARAPTIPTNPKYQQHVRVSSIESFPTHNFSDSKFQQLRDLFRFSYSTPMGYASKHIMTAKDESCH
ncbi:hypothetical protein BGX26_010500 [Mortierella sp. AD094]|nr:hypothetical protein BGX26_010500 [Mortierella sp. AD094]